MTDQETSGRLDDVQEALLQDVRQGRTDQPAAAYVRLLTGLLHHGRQQDALTVTAAVEGVCRQDAGYWFQRGLAHEAARQLPEAEQAYQTCLQQPDAYAATAGIAAAAGWQAHAALARLSLACGDKEAASGHLSLASRLNPGNDALQRQLVQLALLDQPLEIVEAILAQLLAAATGPRRRLVAQEAAKWLFAQDRADQALALLQRQVELAEEADKVGAVLDLAQAYELTGQPAQALETLVSRWDDPEVARRLGLLYHRAGNWEGLDKVCQTLQAAGDGATLTRVWCGSVAAAKGDHEAAQAALDQALAGAPQDVETLAALGLLAHVVERFDEAAHAYDRVLAMQPDLVPARINRIRLALGTGDAAGAWQHLQTFLSLLPAGLVPALPPMGEPTVEAVSQQLNLVLQALAR